MKRKASPDDVNTTSSKLGRPSKEYTIEDAVKLVSFPFQEPLQENHRELIFFMK
jgi:hypothetical protein